MNKLYTVFIVGLMKGGPLQRILGGGEGDAAGFIEGKIKKGVDKAKKEFLDAVVPRFNKLDNELKEIKKELGEIKKKIDKFERAE